MRLAWLALAALPALVSPATATAGFSSQLTPVAGPAPSANTTVTDLAVDPAGGALIAWMEGGTGGSVAKLRRLAPDGALGPTLTISDGSFRASEPKIGLTPGGRALVAWSERLSSADPSFIRARWVEPDGTLGPQIPVRNAGAASDSADMAVAATSTGAVVVAWHNFTSTPGPFRRVEARRVLPDGNTGPLIFPASGAGSTGVLVAADSSGGTLMTWRESAVQAQSVTANDVPGTLHAPGPGATAFPALATDGNDHFQLLYRVGAGASSLEYRALAADGSFGPAQTLDPPAAGLVGGYDVATNAANRSLAAWARPEGGRSVVKARFIAPDGTPEAATLTAPDPAGDQQAPNVGISGGVAALAWNLNVPATPSSLWGRTIPAGEPVRLSSPGVESSTALVEIGAAGVGVAAWLERFDPESPASQAQVVARQILPPPTCPDAAGTVVQGRPARIELACTGLQLEAPEVLTQPAHGTLSTVDAASGSVVYTPTPGYEGTDSFTFRGRNRGGPGAMQTATLSVGRDTIAPIIESFRISRRTLRIAARRRPLTRLRLRYSELATATVTVERRRKCPRKPRRRSRRCKPYKAVGRLATRTPATAAALAFRGKIGRRKLAAGRYRATAVARDAVGNRSKAKRLTFKVVRRKAAKR